MVQQHLTSREETQLSSHTAKPNIKESRKSHINHNGELYDLPKSSLEKEVKINFNRSKSLLDAFNMKFNTYDTSDNNFSDTLVTEDDKDTKSNLRSIDRKVNFPNELGLRTTVNEVNIQPRPKYTHSYVTSSTRSPILSVTTYLNPTEKSFVIVKDTSEQNKNLKPDKENDRNPLQKSMRFFDTGSGTEFNTELYNRETEVENSSYIMSKYINKLHQNKHSSENVSLKIENMSEQHPFLANDYLYFAKKKPLNVPETYSVQDTTGATQENTKLRNNASLKEISETSSAHKIDGEKEGFENYDRKITTHNVAKGDRTALNEAPLVKKLVGENGLFTLLLNESKQKTEENPDDLNSKTERYLNKFVNDKKNKKYILPLSDALSRTEESYVNENTNTNPPHLDHSTSFSKNSLVLNEFPNEHGTSQIGNLFTTGLKNDFKEGNNQLQIVRTQNSFDGGKPLSKELERGISISKQNLTYEEHIIEPLPKIKVQPELFISSNSSSKSYVSVPNFSSFPELYTSPVSGYYITELPPDMKQLPSNFKKRYDGRAKNRITRLDGESYKLESTTENSLQTKSDLLLSETESIYATPKSTSTHSYEEFENQYNSNVNLNTPVTEETLLEATKKLLLLESHRETNFENGSFLGPELLFENSHVVWPNFPPRSLFYSPYPALKRSKSQLGATEPLTFFPRPPKRNKVYPSNNNAMRYDDANHDQESSQATEHYSSSTTNFDLAKVLQSEVLRQFLSHSPDKVVQSFPDTQPSKILIQPTVEVYSESNSSNPLEETSFKLGPSLSSTPSEMEHENDSPAFSTLQTDYMPLHDENVYDGVRKGEDLQKISYINNRVPNIPLIEDHNTSEHTETQESLLKTSQSSSATSPGHNHELKTILEPPDVLDINGLRSSSETTVEDSFKHSEIVKSLSFDFDSPEGREQFEAARSRGLFKR